MEGTSRRKSLTKKDADLTEAADDWQEPQL